MKKTAIFILVCIILMQAFSPMTFAAIQSNKYINAYGANISSPSSDTVRIDFNVLGTKVMSSLGATTIDLYKDGSLVKTFSRFNPLYTAAMVATDNYIMYGHVTYPATSGSSYYAVVTVFASDETGTGTEGCTTGTITIP